MAKNIHICSRNKHPSGIQAKVLKICNELAPDNIIPKLPRVVIKNKTALAVMNPSDTICIIDCSLLMGKVFDSRDCWHIPKTKFPEGSYALFRNSEDYCEVVTDAVASRTIWYYFDDIYFITATSQRAIIKYLNSYKFNDCVIPWMLSTGSLGPHMSWDKRIHRIPPDSSIVLDKKLWTINKRSNIIRFNSTELTIGEHKTNLNHKIQETFNNLDLDFSKWYLPLSGGFDSRGILCFFSKKIESLKNLKTITWGLASSQNETESDAYVAKNLASYFNVENSYYNTDISAEPMAIIIDRFLKLGEGRVDHIAGYMDGFHIWKTLYENGIDGIIRGDEGFGWNAVPSELYVRLSTGSALCSDYENLKDYKKYGFVEQVMPVYLERNKMETLSQWRDRVYHEYRLPTIIAALTDLKLSYVEQISPLLTKKILTYVRELPDQLRTNKILFKEIVNDFSIDMDYATKDSIASKSDILKSKEIIDIFKKELLSKEAKKIFPQDFLKNILKNLKSENIQKEKNKISNAELKKILNIMPNFLKDKIRRHFFKPKIDHNIVAFRVYIVCKMYKLLSEDAKINLR